jgi:hypothetical protein
MDYTGIVRDPADDAFLTPLIGKARLSSGDASFAAAEAGGRTLSYEQAMDEVKAWLDSSR